MADVKEKDSAPQKQGMPMSVKVAIFIILICLVIFFPTTVLLCGCMLPSVVAAMIEDRPQKTAWLTVGAMNFAGFVPTWFKLLERGHTIDTALSLLMRPENLFYAYGGAGIGWVIYTYVPPVVAGFLARQGDRRLKDIEKRARELVRRWGPEVGGEQKK